MAKELAVCICLSLSLDITEEINYMPLCNREPRAAFTLRETLQQKETQVVEQGLAAEKKSAREQLQPRQ